MRPRPGAAGGQIRRLNSGAARLRLACRTLGRLPLRALDRVARGCRAGAHRDSRRADDRSGTADGAARSRGRVSRPGIRRPGRRRRLARVAQGGDVRNRRRVGVRQVDPGPGDAATGGAGRRRDHARRRADRQQGRPRRVPPPAADDLPGPLPDAQSAAARADDRHRAAQGAEGRRRRARAAGAPGAHRCRPRSGAVRRALSAPALGWPAPAGGDRRGPRARARRSDLRRARLDARRLGAGADPRACCSSSSADASWRCCSSPTT